MFNVVYIFNVKGFLVCVCGVTIVQKSRACG